MQNNNNPNISDMLANFRKYTEQKPEKARSDRFDVKPPHISTANNSASTDSRRASFDELKRKFEIAYNSGEYGAELYALAQAVAHSVINKCIDPQRKQAAEKGASSNSGCNPVMLQLKREITADIALLENTRNAHDKATHYTHNADGDIVRETLDADMKRGADEMTAETLGEGIDLVNEAAAAILAEAEKQASRTCYSYFDDKDNLLYEGYENPLDFEVTKSTYLENDYFIEVVRGISLVDWLDTPYTTRRLARRVYIRLDDSAAYRDEKTTSMREIYRAVRRYIMNNRAEQVNTGKYTYIEAETENELDTIYYRLGKYTDMGDYNGDGLYTVGAEAVREVNDLIAAMNLTARQAQVLALRMQGNGYKAIATYLGVTQRAIAKTLEQIQTKYNALKK